jgi:hypothetical protein
LKDCDRSTLNIQPQGLDNPIAAKSQSLGC